ncbi:MAG: 23S rRNA (uracil(1939)-C(5))-methyltransferase RlmD [Erysipelotrichaceae bacterium]
MLKIGQKIKVQAKFANAEGTIEVRMQKDKVLVPHLLLGEEAEVEITKQIRDAYIGKVVRVTKKSKDRDTVRCPIYERCGSCHLLHQTYESQLVDKQNYVRQLAKDARVNIAVAPTVGMSDPYAYRNKIIIGYAKDKQRKLISGFYEEYSHNIIPFKRCLLHEEKSDTLLETIHNLVVKFRIEPFNADRRTGLLRHVLIRRGFATDETMVVFVVSKRDVIIQNLTKELLKKVPSITSVVMNINARKTSIVLGDEEKVLYGPGFIVDTLCGLKFKLSPKSFYQINHDQTQHLYNKAIELLACKGNEVIMDAYSGIGTIGLIASKHVKEVISVELNKDAVNDAIQNAKMNGIRNVRFFNDDATKFMVRMAAEKKRIDGIFIDPPRSGSTPEFIAALAKMGPKKVVYVSCNPETLVRDLKDFFRFGYSAEEIIPFDMFPQTRHVESVVLLTKK